MITVCLITMDRSPDPNYLPTTLENLKRGGVFSSPCLRDFKLFDSTPGGYAENQFPGHADTPIARRLANDNVAAALRWAGQQPSDWVLFLEDDIDVCGQFLESTSTWLAEHAHPDYRVYSLAANYDSVIRAAAAGQTALHYANDLFYGTQAFVVRSADAVSLADYITENCFVRSEDGTAWDLLIADWLRVVYPDTPHLLTPCPSFVQHIGHTSVVQPRNNIHTFPSWPGRLWSYKGKRPIETGLPVVLL